MAKRRQPNEDLPFIDAGHVYDPTLTYYFYDHEACMLRDTAGLELREGVLLTSKNRPVTSVSRVKRSPFEAVCAAEEELMRSLKDICDRIVKVRAAVLQVEPLEAERLERIVRRESESYG